MQNKARPTPKLATSRLLAEFRERIRSCSQRIRIPRVYATKRSVLFICEQLFYNINKVNIVFILQLKNYQIKKKLLRKDVNIRKLFDESDICRNT